MSDFFVNEDEGQEEQKTPKRPTNNGKSQKKTTTTTEQPKEQAPPQYIPIKLSSLGKLSMPATVHVRDYNGKDALDLSLTNDEDILRTLIYVLQNMIYEDINANELHESEMEEIMLNVMVNFWTPVLQEFPFPYTDEEWDSIDEERKNRIRKGHEKLVIDLNVADARTQPIPEKFKEPVNLEGKNSQGEDKKFSFILPRVGHYFVAEDYVDERYAYEEQKWSNFEKLLNKNRNIDEKFQDRLNNVENQEERERIQQQIDFMKEFVDPHQLKMYRDYMRRRNSDYLVVKQAQMIAAEDGKKLESLEDKIDAYPRVPMLMWAQLNQELNEEGSLAFGIDHELTVTSPVDGNQVTRRFQFRPVDLLSPIQLQDSGNYTLSFGDE